MPNKYYYHLTTQDALPDILTHGLTPRIGTRSKMVGEQTPAIYLCRRQDIPSWKIILNLPVLLKIKQLDLSQPKFYQYSCYGEYLYTEPIPPEQIEVVHYHTTSYPDDIMKSLCLTYIHDISRLCVLITQYYTYRDTNQHAEWMTTDYIKYSLMTYTSILENLDYTTCTKQEIRQELREIGDGGTAFTDKYLYQLYNNPDAIPPIKTPRLYTMLIQFQKDELYPYRKKLHKLIVNKFQGCLRVNTGGWTN